VLSKKTGRGLPTTGEDPRNLGTGKLGVKKIDKKSLENRKSRTRHPHRKRSENMTKLVSPQKVVSHIFASPGKRIVV